MIRNEFVSVHVGTQQIYPQSVQVTRGVGRGYNTCSINGTNIAGNVGDTVTVTINADTYTFLLTDKSYSERGNISMECKGIPFILENQSSSDELLEYTSSSLLIENERGIVAVQNNLPTINFNGQSYNKANTPMGRIQDMVNIVGGEAYEYNETLYLDEIKSISQMPTIKHDFDSEKVFSYAYSDKMQQADLLQSVLVNPITDDIYTNAKITVEYDSDILKANVYFNPSLTDGTIPNFLGLVAQPAFMKTKIENILLDGGSQLETVAGIDTINYITIDGEPYLGTYTSYAPYNIVRFDELVYGEISISYTTKSIVCYVNSTVNFIIKYKCAKSEGLIEVDANSTTTSQNCKVEISDKLTYEYGGDVKCYKDNDVKIVFMSQKGLSDITTISSFAHAGGGLLTIKYTHAPSESWDLTFMQNITSILSTEIKTDSGTISFDEELQKYVVWLQAQPLSIIEILEGGVALTGYTYITGEKPYIEFLATDDGRSINISYYIEMVTINIPPPNLGHVVKIMDVVGCGGISSRDFDGAEDKQCSIPAVLEINVAERMNVPISQAYNKFVIGDNGIGMKQVNSFGNITVRIISALYYTITCDSVRPDGKIFIDARGVANANI